jgi:hypothetical protein
LLPSPLISTSDPCSDTELEAASFLSRLKHGGALEQAQLRISQLSPVVDLHPDHSSNTSPSSWYTAPSPGISPMKPLDVLPLHSKSTVSNSSAGSKLLQLRDFTVPAYSKLEIKVSHGNDAAQRS